MSNSVSIWPLLLVLGAMLAPTLTWLGGESHYDAVKIAVVGGLALAAGFSFLLQPAKASTGYLLAAAIPILAVYLIGTTTSSYFADNSGIKTIVQFSLVLLWLVALSSHTWNHETLRVAALLAFSILVVHAGAIAVRSFPEDFSGFTNHKNALGSLCLAAIFLLAAQDASRPTGGSRWPLLLLPVPVALSLYAHSRGPLVAVAVALLVFPLWRLITANRTIHAATFMGAILAALWGCYVYTSLGDYPWFQGFQEEVWQLTGQNIYTGRNLIWPILFDAIGDAPYLGYGSGVSPNYFLQMAWLDVTWSAHNLYFTIAIQIGLIGMAAFIYYLLAIWYAMRDFRDDRLVRVSALFFLGVCIHQCFEVSLTQNNLDAGLILWLLPAVGLSKILERQPDRSG